MTYEEMIQQYESERKKAEQLALDRGMNFVVNSNPEKEARVQKIENTLGVRIEKDEHLEEIEKANERKKLDVYSADLPERNPVLARWLRNEKNSQLVRGHEQVRALDEVSNAANGMHFWERVKGAAKYELDNPRVMTPDQLAGGARAIWTALSGSVLRAESNIQRFFENLIEGEKQTRAVDLGPMEAILEEVGGDYQKAIDARTLDIINNHQYHPGLQERFRMQAQARRELGALLSRDEKARLVLDTSDEKWAQDVRFQEGVDKIPEAVLAVAEAQNNRLAWRWAEETARSTGIDPTLALKAVLGGAEERDEAQGLITDRARMEAQAASGMNPFFPWSQYGSPVTLLERTSESAVETGVGMALAAGGTAIGGPPLGIAVGMAAFTPTSIGQMRNDLLQVKDEDGNPLPEEYIVRASNLGGIVVAAFEGTLNELGVKMTGIDRVAARVFRQEARTALGPTNRGWMRKGFEYATSVTGEPLSESLEEFEQTFVTAVAEEFAMRAANEKYNGNFVTRQTAADWAPVMQEAIQSAKEAFYASLLFGASGAHSTYLSDQAEERRVENNMRWITAMVNQVKQSELAELDAPKLEAYLREHLPDTAKNSYIATEDWDKLWAEHKIDGRKAWEQIFGNTDAYDAAKNDPSGNMRAKLDTATVVRAASSVGSKERMAIIDMMRETQVAMSPEEVKARTAKVRAEYRKEIENLEAEIKEQENPEEALKDDTEREYFTTLRDQLVQANLTIERFREDPEGARRAGQDQAAMFLAVARVNSERSGIPLMSIMTSMVKQAGGTPEHLQVESLDPESNGGVATREVGYVPYEWLQDLVESYGEVPGSQAGRTPVSGEERAVVRVTKDGKTVLESGLDYLRRIAGTGASPRVEVRYEDGSERDHQFQADLRTTAIPEVGSVLNQMTSNQLDRQLASATSRTWKVTQIGKFAMRLATAGGLQGMTVVDFGAGHMTGGARALAGLGIDTIAVDFYDEAIARAEVARDNAKSEIQRAEAEASIEKLKADRERDRNQVADVVFASNVINVSHSWPMLRDTLSALVSTMKSNGVAFINYPSTPRRMYPNGTRVGTRIQDDQMIEVLGLFFEHVSIEEKTSSGPIFKCVGPIRTLTQKSRIPFQTWQDETVALVEDEVSSVLTSDLLSKEWREKITRKTPHTTGHCYAASEAAYHLLGGKEFGWTPVVLTHENWPKGLKPGETHWFLRHQDGTIVDPTRAQFAGKKIPYELGTGKGFQTPGGRMSARARKIVSRVAMMRANPSKAVEEITSLISVDINTAREREQFKEDEASKYFREREFAANQEKTRRHTMLMSAAFHRWFRESQGVDPYSGMPHLFAHGTVSHWTDKALASPMYGELGFHTSADWAVSAKMFANMSDHEVLDDSDLVEYLDGVEAQGAVDRGYAANSKTSRVYLGWVSAQNPVTLIDRGSWQSGGVLNQLVEQGLLSVEEARRYDEMMASDVEIALSENHGIEVGEEFQTFLYVHGTAYLAILDLGFDSVKYINRREIVTGWDNNSYERKLPDSLGDMGDSISVYNLFSQRPEAFAEWMEDNPADFLASGLAGLFVHDQMMQRLVNGPENLDTHDLVLLSTFTNGPMYRMWEGLSEDNDITGPFAAGQIRKYIRERSEQYVQNDPDVVTAIMRLAAVLRNHGESGLMRNIASLINYTRIDQTPDSFFRYVGPEAADSFILLHSSQYKSLSNNGDFNLNEGNMLLADIAPARDSMMVSKLVSDDVVRNLDVLGIMLPVKKGVEISMEDALTSQLTKLTKEAEKIKDPEKRAAAMARIPTMDEVLDEYKRHIINFPSALGWAKDYLVPSSPVVIDENSSKGWKLNFRNNQYRFNVLPNGKRMNRGGKGYDEHIAKMGDQVAAEVTALAALAAEGESLPEHLRTPQMQKAMNHMKHLTWYYGTRETLREEFGGLGDMFADLLAATSANTPVPENWDSAIVALRRALAGEFDDVMDDVVIWADEYDARKRAMIEYFVNESGKQRTAKSIMADKKFKELKAKFSEVSNFSAGAKTLGLKLPLKEDDKTRFGFNTNNVALALADLYRIVIGPDNVTNKKMKPKTRNFSGNLAGFTEKATIDVWAARFLRRIADKVYPGQYPRITPAGETGVTGEYLGGVLLFGDKEFNPNDLTKPLGDERHASGEFGVGQDVFEYAVQKLRGSGIEAFANLTAQEIQALVWFREKDIWTANGWSTKEGGSFEEQIERESIRRYYTYLDEGEDAFADEDVKEIVTAAMATDAREFLNFKAKLNKQGAQEIDPKTGEPVFHEKTERRLIGSKVKVLGKSIDAEFISRKDWEVDHLLTKLVSIASKRGIGTVSISRVVREGDPLYDPEKARPMLEVWLAETADHKQALAVAARATRGTNLEVDLVSDLRGDQRVRGIRISWNPETNEESARALAAMSSKQLKAEIAAHTDRMHDGAVRLVQELGQEAVLAVSSLTVQTQTIFSTEYQDVLREGSAKEAGRGGWRGIREGSRRATEHYDQLRLEGLDAIHRAGTIGADFNESTNGPLGVRARYNQTNSQQSSPFRGGTHNLDIDTESAQMIAKPMMASPALRSLAHIRLLTSEQTRRGQDVSLIGKAVPREFFPMLLQSYSKNSVETMRLIVTTTTPEGKVALSNETAWTARLPGVVYGFPGSPGYIESIRDATQWLFDNAKGVDGARFWLTHNHPGGWAGPSGGDVQWTKWFQLALFAKSYLEFLGNLRNEDAVKIVTALKNFPSGAVETQVMVLLADAQTRDGKKISQHHTPDLAQVLSVLTKKVPGFDAAMSVKTSTKSGKPYVAINTKTIYSTPSFNDLDYVDKRIPIINGPNYQMLGEYNIPMYDAHIVTNHRSFGMLTPTSAGHSFSPQPVTPYQTWDLAAESEQDPTVREHLENLDHIDMTLSRKGLDQQQIHMTAGVRSMTEDYSGPMGVFPEAFRDPAIGQTPAGMGTAKPGETREVDDLTPRPKTEEVASRPDDQVEPTDAIGTLLGGFSRGGSLGVMEKRTAVNLLAKLARRRGNDPNLITAMAVGADGTILSIFEIDTSVHDLKTNKGKWALAEELSEYRRRTGAFRLVAGNTDTQQALYKAYLVGSGAIDEWAVWRDRGVSTNPIISRYSVGDQSQSNTRKTHLGTKNTYEFPAGSGNYMTKIEKLYQAAGDVRRGYYDPVAKKIQLLNAADPSTMIHELGHAFMAMLMEIESRPDANAIAQEDREVLMKFLGITAWGEVDRAVQEKFADAFMRYVAEGVSPTTAMQDMFARAHSWMIEVYGQIDAVGVPITAEVRQVFDRLLASRSQIEQSRRLYRLKTAMELHQLADENDWVEYEKLAREADQLGETQLRREVAREALRETEVWFRDTKRRIRAETEDEMAREPVWAALGFLQYGKLPVGIEVPPSWLDENGKPLKLDGAWLKDNYGAERVKKLPKPYVYTATGGLDPQAVAEFFGLESEDVLIEEIEARSGSYKQELEQRVDKKIAERFGDMMRNRQQLIDRAADSVHNESAFEMLIKEAQMVAKALGGKNQFQPRRNSEAMKLAAEEEVKQERVGDLKPHLYSRMEAKLANEFRKLLNEGKLQEAYKVQERRLWAHAMYRATRDAKERSEKTRRKIRDSVRPAALKRIGKAGAYYVESVKAIAEMFSTDQISAKQQERLEGLRFHLMKIMTSDENDLIVPEELINKAKKTTYREATVEDFDELRRSLDNILHLARKKSQIKARRQRIDFDQAVDELVASARANIKESGNYHPDKHNEKARDRIRRAARKLDSNLVRLEPIIDLLDGGKIDGPWRRYFWNLFVDAQHEQASMMQEYAQVIEDVYTMISKKGRRDLYTKKIHIKSAGTEFTKQAMIVVALNMGTESNYQRLVQGKQRNTNWDAAVIDEMISHLTDEDWNFIEGVWAALESMYPRIADLEERLTGIAPPQLEARSFEVKTKEGTTRTVTGGYYPLVYSELTRAGRLQDPDKPLSDKEYIRAMTPHGWVNARQETVRHPILLDLDVFPSHIMSVIHDLTHREAVIEAGKILADEEIRLVITDTLGKEYLKVFDEMLRRVARENNQKLHIEGMIRKMRSNVTVMTMGFKATVAYQNIANMSNVLEPDIGVRADYLAMGTAKWTKNPVQAHQFCKSKSKELAHRFTSFDRDVRTVTRQMTGRTSMKAYITRAAFAGIAMTDMFVAESAWIGAYHQQMDQGLTEEEAIDYADRMVRETLGAGGAKDLSLVQGNDSEAMKWWTMYYSWFANAYGRFWALKRGVDAAYSEKGFMGLARFAPMFIAKSMTFWIIPALVAEILANRGPGDDDDDESSTTRWIFAKALLYPFYTIPIIRDIAGGIEGLISGEPARVRTGQMADIMTKVGRTMSQYQKVAKEEDGFLDIVEELADNGRFTDDLMELVGGVGLGLPIKQSKITLGYWRDVWTGDEDPESLWEFFRDSSFYRRKD